MTNKPVLTADKEEILRVYDEQGNFSGRYEKRSVVHQLGLFHQEVSFLPLNRNKQILLERRSVNKKSYPNCWAICAGHVVEDQTTLEAVKMEVGEELGITLDDKDFIMLINKTKNIRDDNNAIMTCYYQWIDKPLSYFKKQDEEVEELRWFDLKDFEKMIHGEQDGSYFKDNEFYNEMLKKLKKLVKF